MRPVTVLPAKQEEKRRVPTKLALPTLREILFIDTGDIVYCKAEGNYTFLYTHNAGRIVVSRKMKDLEARLPENFFRIHHSHIVNLHYIDKYVQGRGGYVVLKDGTAIGVSARKKEQFLALFL